MKTLISMILSVPLLAACASQPPIPNEELAVARSAVANAEDAGAREHAELDLRRARLKLEQAEQARQLGDNQTALQMAEQAEMDARYAAFRARSKRANDAVEELERGIAELRSEVARTLEQSTPGDGQ
ncbi:MAG: DUF4398 domain-containing protein [Chromatocurvus sp.]